MKKIGVLIVTFNRIELLKEEINSIRNQSYKDFDILVVNNGSTDGTSDWLETQNDVITITQENLGGAGGFHTGIKYLAEKGYEYCWLMDDDVECSPSALEIMINAAEAVDNLGFLCSRVFGLDGSLMNVPSIETKGREGKYASWLERIDEKMIGVKSATFVSVLFPLSHALNLGLPYKEYFIWGDDIEYTTRISQKYNCYLVYDSIVIHKRALVQGLDFMKETNTIRLKNHFYRLRNGFVNRKKYGNAQDVVIYLCYQFALLFKAIIHFDFLRISILLNVLFREMFFAPKLEYPNVHKDKNI